MAIVKSEKLPRKSKKILYFTYSIGGLAEAGLYQYITTFQLIFLTGVVKIPPEVAGSITSVAILLEAACCFVVGHLSDSLRWRYGRRRPFIFLSAFLLPFTMTANFITVQASIQVQAVYYILMGSLFWIAYSLFYIPYTALGAEIAVDYDARTKLRSIARVFTISGTFIANVCPLLAIGILIKAGMADGQAWLLFTIFMSALVGIGVYICWYNTAGTERMEFPDESTQEKIKKQLLDNFVSIIKDFYELMRLKAMAILVGTKIVFMFGFTLYTSGMMFFMQYALNLDIQVTSTVYMVSIFASILFTPLITHWAVRGGKKSLISGAMTISGLCGVLLWIFGVDSYVASLMYVIVFTFGQAAFWQISSAMFYDVAEADEYVSGKRREGAIIAFQSIVGTLSASLGLQAIGLLLKLAGFNEALSAQSAETVKMLKDIFVLFPSVSLLVTTLTLLAYPLSKKRFELLQKALALRSRGEDYSEYRTEIDKWI
ncbi:MAG: MFS transporter [Anaerovoracaceae bacterium]|jgi:GPH family glycoside/pentoside/hexuronide:cation symporter